MPYSGAVAGIEEAYSSISYFRGESNGHNASPDGSKGYIPPVTPSGYANQDLAPHPVHKAISHFFRHDVASLRKIATGLSQKAQDETRIRHHPPIGRSPSKTAERILAELNRMSLESCFESAEF